MVMINILLAKYSKQQSVSRRIKTFSTYQRLTNLSARLVQVFAVPGLSIPISPFHMPIEAIFMSFKNLLIITYVSVINITSLGHFLTFT